MKIDFFLIEIVLRMYFNPIIYVDDIECTGLLKLNSHYRDVGMISLTWNIKERTEELKCWKIEVNLTNVSCITTYVKEMSYNDKHKMLFINYKGPVHELKNYWAREAYKIHQLEHCISMGFSQNAYKRVQRYLKQLGFKK